MRRERAVWSTIRPRAQIRQPLPRYYCTEYTERCTAVLDGTRPTEYGVGLYLFQVGLQEQEAETKELWTHPGSSSRGTCVPCTGQFSVGR